jgi:hypothetical protein
LAGKKDKKPDMEPGPLVYTFRGTVRNPEMKGFALKNKKRPQEAASDCRII